MKLTCPTKNRLREFLEGSVADADADQISDHVEDCQTCDLVLSTLESEQSDLLKELREGIRTESLLQEPEFEKLRNTARFSQADTTAVSDVDDLPETGKRLRDYRLVKKIGEGGMGTVYQAFHVHLAKHVALKILPSDKLRSKQSVARFRQEMRAVGQVNHPNVVSASDAGTIDGQHFLVMELVQGADLARIIQDRGPLNVADACEIVRQAAIGLQHAHDNGLVHRDVKPSNVMLAIDGSVKLLDLGLAGLNNSEFESTANVVVTDGLTSVGQIMGTLDYMAPEQITASPDVDGKADVYALGATLFQLLTGRTPCGERSEGTPQRIEAVLHKPPLDIATLRNDVPEELRALLLKMLAKNPEDRPQSAIDVAGELVQFTSDADLDALAEACRTSLDMPSADVDVTDDVSFVVSRTAQSQDDVNSRRPLTAVALGGLFFALVVAVVYYIVTNNGIVRVEVTDPSLKVAISGQTITMTEDNKKPLTIRPGEQLLVIRRGDSDFEFETDRFQIRRGDNIAFKVELQQGEVVVTKNDKPFDRMRAMPPGIESSEEPHKAVADRANSADVAKAKEALSQDQIPALNPLSGMTLLGLGSRDKGVKWVFAQEKVTITNNGQDIPAEITSEILKDAAGPRRIEASWTLRNRNSILQLSNLQVDGKPSPQEVELPLGPLGNIRVNIGEHQYNKSRARVLGGHDYGVRSIALSPDGELLASASQLKVLIRRLSDGEIMTTIKGAKGNVVFDRQGKRVAAVNMSKRWGIGVWDVATGKKKHSFKTEIHPLKDAYGMAFSPDGQRLAVGCDDGLRVWNLNSGEEQLFISGHEQNGNVTAIAFSPDGAKFASANWGGNYSEGDGKKKAPNEVKLWDATTGKELMALNGGGRGLAFSRDGAMIASGGPDGTASVWDVSTGEELQILRGHTGIVWAVALSPDGKQLATAGDDRGVRVWDLRNGKEITVFDGHESRVRSLVFSPDGKCLYSASEDKTIRVWDIAVRENSVGGGRNEPKANNNQPEVFQATPVPGMRRLELPALVVDVSQDEKMALLADDFGSENIPVGVPRMWSLQDNKEVSKLPALNGFYLRFVPGNRPLCMAGDPRRQEVRFWDIDKGSWHGDWIGHDLRGGFDYVFWPVFSPDGETASIVSLDGEMQFWNLRGDKPVEIKPPVDKPLPKRDASKLFCERQFSSDGKYCFAIFDDKLWVLDPGTATTVAGPFLHRPARDLGISWPSVLYNSISETLVTIESSGQIRPATLRFRSAKRNWEIAHSATVTGKVGSVSFLGPNHVLSGGIGLRKAEWGGQTAQHVSTVVPIQPGNSSNQVLERDAYTYAFAPDGKQWVGMSDSSVYTGRLGQEEIAWRQPLPRIFKDDHYVDYKLSGDMNWVVTHRTKKERIAVAVYSLNDGRLLLDKSGLKNAVHVKSTIALGREVFRFTPQVAKTLPASDLRPAQKMISVPTEGKTAFEGNGTYFAKAQLSEDAKTALVESGAILQMWNLETGQLTSISEWGGQGGVVGFVPEANLVWHAEHGVEFWDMGKSARTDLEIPHLTGPSESTPMPPAFSEDGKLLATQADVGKFRLWNLETQKPLSPAIEAGTLLYRLTFSPNGKWLFTEDKSGWCIWDVATQKRVAGPLMDHLSDRNTDIAVSPDSSSIAAIEGKLPRCEIVIRVAQGETWKEHKRIPIPNPVVQAMWVDSQHLAIVVEFRNQTYGLKVISIDALEVQDYGYLRTFDKIKVAPDRQHLVVSNFAAVTCWKLGRKEHLWKIGTSEAGRSHDVHFGKDWVLLHEKGETTGARPAIVRSLDNGNEIFRKDNVIATAVNGTNICLVDATGIEVWRVNHDEIRSP